MAMEDLKAVKAFKYAGRDLSPGDTFQAPPSHARVLVAMGKAQGYVAKVVKAKAPAAPRSPASKAPDSGRRGGGYQRRDMTAAPAVVADDSAGDAGDDASGDSGAEGGAE